MLHKVCLFLLIIILMPQLSYSKIGFQYSVGSHSEDFKGIHNSDFNQIQQMVKGFSLFYEANQWLYKIESNQVDASVIDEFILSDGQIGKFQISFQQMILGFGKKIQRTQLFLLLGQQALSWQGSIEMHPQKVQTPIYGLEFAYILFEKNYFLLPLSLRALQQSDRNLNFEDYPLDTLNIQKGNILEVRLGIALQF